MNSVIDFGLSWNWEYDRDFAHLMETECRSCGLSFLAVTPENVETISAAVGSGTIRFRALWDRAADSDDRFLLLTDRAKSDAIMQINPHENAVRTWNKATMHLEFINAGVYTPYTIVLDPYHGQPILREIDLNILGKRFIIKPAHGGGGVGVILDATGLERVLAARLEHPNDYYLLQAVIEPVLLNDRPAWFRVIYVCGESYFCWWDVRTHVYTPFSASDKEFLPMPLLKEILSKIATLTGLDVFSSEIALTAEGNFVVVDYINDPLDLRQQSEASDGVPNDIVRAIATKVAETVRKVLLARITTGELGNKESG